jgi:dTDP-4-dehydrorhamnose reductase
MHARHVLILGCRGQLGVELSKEFERRGWRVSGTDRQTLDITDEAAVEARLAATVPQLVINAAAYNMVDVAEREPLAAFQVNALAVRNIALACARLDARLVHFSTDYVFDGAAGRPYTEQDQPHPLGAYAVSKLAGEFYARAYLDDVLVIRTSGVYGPAGQNTPRGNFVELMCRLAREGQPIRVVEDHVASPTYAPALAARTADLVERDIAGIIHLGGETPISWFAFAEKIFAAAGLEAQLKATNEREYRTAARRPKYSALANARAATLGLAPMPSLEQALQMYFEERAKRAPAAKSA